MKAFWMLYTRPQHGVRCLGVICLLTLVFPARHFAQSADNSIPFRIPMLPGPHCPVSADQLKAVQSFAPDQPIVGTHFFYWYDVDSRAHFIDADGTDALTDHPAHVNGYSYKSARWWKRELLDVMAAQIDFVLPVYWGCPGNYADWSFVGLPPLVQAWNELDKEGRRPPRVGLFYDTSTLQYNPRSWHVDLSTESGKNWFYATIRDFFSFVPPKMWAALGGRPIVVLYSPNFAAKQDPKLFPFVRKEFQRDFSTDIFLVKNVGWRGEADRECSWGGALGLQSFSVTSLGPGYDHSAVPNRRPLIVDREHGAFYERLWKQLLSRRLERRSNIALVETWNELHEGTDVCDSREYGRQYIQLTAKYAAQFHHRVVLPKTGPFANASLVEWQADRSEPIQGITILNAGDGLTEATSIAGNKCRRSKSSQFHAKYIYADLHDSFLFDEENESVSVSIEYLDRGFGSFLLEYDCNDSHASVRDGAFKPSTIHVHCTNTGTWRTVEGSVDGGRFANRCNGGDFRLAILTGDLAIRRIIVKRQM